MGREKAAVPYRASAAMAPQAGAHGSLRHSGSKKINTQTIAPTDLNPPIRPALTPRSPLRRRPALRPPPPAGMSAGQRQHPRKRPTNPSLPPNHHHRSRPKRPKLDSPPPLSLSPHVRLRFDGASRRVLPAEEQIGIPWSRLAPFVHAPPRRRASRLADVAALPHEVFALDNLKRVLSYEDVRFPMGACYFLHPVSTLKQLGNLNLVF